MRFAVVCAILAVATTANAMTVADVIGNNANLTTLSSLLDKAGLTSALAGAGPFTVFAPTDAAFAKIEAYKIQLYTDAKNVAVLRGILEYHVTAHNLTTSEFREDQQILTLQGSNVFIQFIDGTTDLGMASATCEKNVRFVGTQVAASNGYVHIIDTVLMPPAILCPDELFWVEQRGASRVGFNGYDCRAKGTQIISKDEIKPVGIAVDSNTQQVFWSNDENAKPFDSWLTSATFDAKNITKFVPNMYDPQGMDTDTVNQKLYFTEHQGNAVSRINYDGTGLERIWTGRNNTDFPADVAVDESAGLVFMTVQSVPSLLNGSVHVQNLDGTGKATIATGLNQNYGLCVDRHARHLYYIQGGHGGSISCFAYGSTACNTKNNTNIVVDGLQYPYMCDVDNLWAPYGGPTRIIFSEPNVPGSVYTVGNDGSDLTLIASDLNAPMGMKLGCRRFFA